MRFSFNWLKRYLSTNLKIGQIADKLTAIGLEVDTLENPDEIFRGFKLVRIKTAQKHPNADRLKICSVEDAAGNTKDIVCGAENAREGIMTVLATPGAIIPATKEVLKESKIRGIVSEGMICSYSELAIPSKKEGIVEINPQIDLSTSVGDALGYDGGIIDVSITPNRGDCFSVKGIARDLAAAGAGSFITASEKIVCNSSFKFPLNIVTEENNLSSEYAPMIAFRVIRGVKNGPSPDWLKSALQLAGLNSISTLVDLSNFWMFDNGRPTHLYDMKKVEGNFHIRFAKVQEAFVDIKGNEHWLFQDMPLMADDKSPLCILGIMGSSKVTCDENTTDILIESGFFNQVLVGKAGNLLNIQSDSRIRFERGIDRSSCIPGLEGITQLILDNCGGEASEIFVVGSEPKNETRITLRKRKLNDIAGYNVDWDEAKLTLKRLSLKEVGAPLDERATFSIPSWRSDLNIEADLVEEILRIKGYDSVQEKSIKVTVPENDKILEKRRQVIAVKRLLAARGLSEIVTYSFTKWNIAEAFREEKDLIKLINPISVDLSVMRPSLLPTLLLNAANSLNYGEKNIGIYEVGNVFFDSCEQSLHISGVRIGSKYEKNWIDHRKDADIFDIKGDVFAVLGYYGISEKDVSISSNVPPYYHPYISGTIILSSAEKIGYFGELHPKIKKLFGITERVICFEIFNDLLSFPIQKSDFFNGKIFPKISRDFSFLFAKKTLIGDIINKIRELDTKISKVVVFDHFKLSDTEKTIGISVVLDAVDRTLTEKEAQDVSDKIIKYVESVGGELRKK
ncbi:MAG: phenylalanine--tRNA ligase subunit beta [Holosporaceae bacterium]|jgi:phenylalanyl-tRNA synthetase beta chain|nr:phenylalanine--tRNA ligase subunit beta [Holosporaceae bacterium]